MESQKQSSNAPFAVIKECYQSSAADAKKSVFIHVPFLQDTFVAALIRDILRQEFSISSPGSVCLQRNKTKRS